jgi:hypothetical protein
MSGRHGTAVVMRVQQHKQQTHGNANVAGPGEVG